MKPVIKYIALWGSGCGLSTDTKAAILRENGTGNVKLVRNATAQDVAWVRGMGGRVPDGRLAREEPAP